MEEWALLLLPVAGNSNTGGATAAGLETTIDAADDAKTDTDDDDDDKSKAVFVSAPVCSSSANETRPGSSSIANACRAKKCAAHTSTLSPRALTGGVAIYGRWRIIISGKKHQVG